MRVIGPCANPHTICEVHPGVPSIKQTSEASERDLTGSLGLTDDAGVNRCIRKTHNRQQLATRSRESCEP